MASKDDLPECCRTGFLWEGTPTGSIITLGNPTDKYVVLWTDVFGHKNPNASIANSGINCVIPDILNGDPVNYEQLEGMAKRPKTYFERIGQVFAALTNAPSFIGWLRRHTEKTTLPFINANNHKATKIGVLGYCFGGRYAILHGGDEPRVDAFATGASIDILAIVKPGLIMCASEDAILPQHQVDTIKKTVEKEGKNVVVKVRFSKHLHGFAIRGNEGEEDTRKARDESLNDTVSFFKANL
ncbi:dienelactone hydrolase [Chytridium lagenaria]|nr:dienelactone hydrolase [Chytridium lagenaria]